LDSAYEKNEVKAQHSMSRPDSSDNVEQATSALKLQRTEFAGVSELMQSSVLHCKVADHLKTAPRLCPGAHLKPEVHLKLHGPESLVLPLQQQRSLNPLVCNFETVMMKTSQFFRGDCLTQIPRHWSSHQLLEGTLSGSLVHGRFLSAGGRQDASAPIFRCCLKVEKHYCSAQRKIGGGS
jgi:hypothetical protein